MKFSETKARKQYIVGIQEYPVEMTFKEVGLENIDLLKLQKTLDKKYFS